MGKRSATWRAIRAPVAVMPMNTGPVQLRMQALVFSPSAVCASSQITIEYASDAPRVAHEPLVGLDGDRAVGVVGAVEQRRERRSL